MHGVTFCKQSAARPYLAPLAGEDVIDAHLSLPGLIRPSADLPRRKGRLRSLFIPPQVEFESKS